MTTIKSLLTILSLVLFFGCSTKNDPEEITSNIIPLAPSNLTGVLVNNQVNLTWTDNSTNETGFKIERKTNTSDWVETSAVTTNVYTYTDLNATVGLTYTYRVYSFNSKGNSLNYSNEFTISIPIQIQAPILNTTMVSSITQTTAISGGTITSDGGAPVLSRGVAWSTSNSLSLSSTKTIDGTGTGSFISSLTTLWPNTTYYVSAYARNSAGTSWGNVVVFTTAKSAPTITDISGNVYETVTICGQVWTKTNLNTTKYRNGDIIPQVTDGKIWNNLSSGAWCYYNNDPTTEAVYGKLYNWYAVTDPRGLAPTGWHVPKSSDFLYLGSNCLGDISTAGSKLKEKGNVHWTYFNNDATNSTGFTALPGGSNGYGVLGHECFFWCADSYGNSGYAARITDLHTWLSVAATWSKMNGCSVRILKD